MSRTFFHPSKLLRPLAGAVLALAAGLAAAHGDVTPQAVDTKNLPPLGEQWRAENPYRQNDAAIKVGGSAYNQNCARCHGLGVVSGGLAPDLRYLEAEEYGDEWYMERFIHGYTQNGITKMPAFGELLGQKAAWAIRTYIETRPDDGALDNFTPRLKEIRDTLANWDGGDLAALTTELRGIADQVETASGAPVADSVAFRAANLIGQENPNLKEAVNQLTIGLSAAE